MTTSDPVLIHIVGVTAVWIIFLTSIRFSLAGFYGLRRWRDASGIWRAAKGWIDQPAAGG